MITQTSKPQRLVRGTGPGTMEHSVSMMIKFATPSITRVAALSALVASVPCFLIPLAYELHPKVLNNKK